LDRLICGLIAVFSGGFSAHAAMVVDASSNWLYGQVTLAGGTSLPAEWPYSRGSDCDVYIPDVLFETRGKRCAVQTPIGLVSDDGIALSGSMPTETVKLDNRTPEEIAEGLVPSLRQIGFIKSNNSQRYIVSLLTDGEIPASATTVLGIYDQLNQTDFVRVDNAAVGAYYQLTRQPDKWVQASNGVSLEVVWATLGVSKNGEWVSGILNDTKPFPHTPSFPVFIYNVRTGFMKVVGLSQGMFENYGDTPSQRSTAVTDNGRHVVTNTDGRSTTIYDTATCNNQLEAYVNWNGGWDHSNGRYCDSRRLWYGWGIAKASDNPDDFLFDRYDMRNRQYIHPAIEVPLGMRFIDDNTLQFVGIDISGFTEGQAVTPQLVRRYTLQARPSLPGQENPPIDDNQPGTGGSGDTGSSSDPTLSKGLLLGMGDSYISGEGAHRYRRSMPGDLFFYNTDAGNNTCHTSEVSYPYLLGQKYFSNYGSVACSGAVTDDILNSDEEYEGQVKDGIGQSYRGSYRNHLLNQYVPGYLNQLQFVNGKQPNVVLLSAGGNDIGFSNIITLCVLTKAESCFETRTERRELVKHMNRLHTTLVETYRKILEASPQTRLYVVGYPQVAKVGGTCGLNVHLDKNEVIFADQLITYLNGVIARAAVSAGAKYVTIEDALVGHRLCEQTRQPAMNGLTAGRDILGVIGQESYHPTAFGHSLIAAAIERRTNNLTAAMPTATHWGPLADNAAEGDEFLSNAVGDSLMERLRYTVHTPFMNTSFSDKAIELTIQTQLYGVRPGTFYSIVFHSRPVEVTNGYTDDEGNIYTTFTLPDNVSPGVHTVHIQTQNDQGQPIDIQQLVYVQASDSDYDGDGVLNNASQCLVISDSGQDSDSDGQDDACDGIIPDQTEPETTPNSSQVDGTSNNEASNKESLTTPPNQLSQLMSTAFNSSIFASARLARSPTNTPITEYALNSFRNQASDMRAPEVTAISPNHAPVFSTSARPDRPVATNRIGQSTANLQSGRMMVVMAASFIGVVILVLWTARRYVDGMQRR
jgi:hypothetical protein